MNDREEEVSSDSDYENDEEEHARHKARIVSG